MEGKGAWLFLVCLMMLHGITAVLNCTSPTRKSLYQQLEKELFPQNLVPPKNNFSEPLEVTISITVVGLLGVDEKTQTMTTIIWQILEWQIDGLSWEKEKCGTERASVPREMLWVPDIQIGEFMDEDTSPKTPYVYLYNTGHVYDDKPLRVVSSCRLEIYTFPFDIQNCTLTFGAYVHFASDIQMIQGATAAQILLESKEVIESNGEWDLIGIHVQPYDLDLEDGSYSQIAYYLTIRRRPMLYVVNLLIPSCFLITVDLFSFLLPPQSVDRSSFKMTLILGYTVFLLIMNDLLPATGETTPLINVFFSLTLALMVTSLLETVFITKVQFSSSQYSKVPKWLSVVVLRYLAVVVCLPPKKRGNRVTVYLNQSREPTMNPTINSISSSHLPSIPDDDTLAKPLSPLPPPAKPDPVVDELRKLSRDLTAIRLQIDNHFKGNDTSQEWEMLGVVIDRLLFGLYIIFILVSFITIISIWIYNNNYSE